MAQSRVPFLSRVYFLKGPVLQEISDVMTSMIFRVLKNYKYDDVEGIKNDLLRRISSMCPGRIDLKDMPIVNESQTMQLDLEHKSIYEDFMKQLVESHRPDSAGQSQRIIVSSKLTSSYKIMPAHLDKKTRQKIHEILNEHNGLHSDDLKITYLQKFNDFSKRIDLYKDTKFLDFLERQIKYETNKHIVLECLYILHSLILTSRVENKDSFLVYVYKHYFSFLNEKSESGAETYEYPLFKIEQIFKEIENFISVDEICNMYWKCLVRIVKKEDYSGNIIGNCIDAIIRNKCPIKPEWRKWLNTEDRYSDIKTQILKEIPDLALF